MNCSSGHGPKSYLLQKTCFEVRGSTSTKQMRVWSTPELLLLLLPSGSLLLSLLLLPLAGAMRVVARTPSSCFGGGVGGVTKKRQRQGLTWAPVVVVVVCGVGWVGVGWGLEAGPKHVGSMLGHGCRDVRV